MLTELLTKEDLQQFKEDLLSEIRKLLTTNAQQKQWLRSAEVRKLLKISPGTLQNMRINGQLSFTRIGNILYYNHADIEKLLRQNSKNT